MSSWAKLPLSHGLSDAPRSIHEAKFQSFKTCFPNCFCLGQDYWIRVVQALGNIKWLLSRLDHMFLNIQASETFQSCERSIFPNPSVLLFRIQPIAQNVVSWPNAQRSIPQFNAKAMVGFLEWCCGRLWNSRSQISYLFKVWFKSGLPSLSFNSRIIGLGRILPPIHIVFLLPIFSPI